MILVVLQLISARLLNVEVENKVLRTFLKMHHNDYRKTEKAALSWIRTSNCLILRSTAVPQPLPGIEGLKMFTIRDPEDQMSSKELCLANIYRASITMLILHD